MDALVDTSKSLSWCASRRCRGSVTEVAEQLTARFLDDATVTAGPGRLTVAPGTSHGVATVGPVRVRRAKLSFGAWRRTARVTIEVEPWSRSESELLVRPTRRPPLGEHAYFEAVLAVLDALAAEIDATLVPRPERAPAELGTAEEYRRAS
jgi:hypothetical protein